ncbi:uncharacterized protein METZ01_LOCUS365885 [marine metagenome]|uniref:Uncharacterized protein n=1 Tax=marine metagenome TaxID=408172 RepID=A0A382SVT6_9ZZZZ
MLSKYFGEHPSLCLVVSGVIGHLTIQRFDDQVLDEKVYSSCYVAFNVKTK